MNGPCEIVFDTRYSNTFPFRVFPSINVSVDVYRDTLERAHMLNKMWREDSARFIALVRSILTTVETEEEEKYVV